MRVLKVMIVSVLCVVIISSFGCGSESGEAELSGEQVVTVQRGDLTIDISAAGNLALSRTADLAFEIAGTVEEALVQEGDTVEEGQVVARLDTSEWEDQIESLEDQLIAAERQLLVKKRDLLQAEIDLKNAELALANAKEALTEEPLDWIATEEGQWYLNREEVEKKELALEIVEIRLEQAQLAVEDAQKDIEDADEALGEAMDASPEVVAPFAGFITKVNVEGGDEVMKGTVAVQLADPNKFEADILVSEMDISQVKLGGTAYVQVDALSGVSLPAEVTHIAPTATIQSGVVNYKVKVEIQSLEAVTQEQQAARQEAMQEIQQGELPERLKQAIEEGLVTQEQAEEMMEQMQQAQGGQPEQVPTRIPEDFQLREGLTVTVSVIVDERSDVLLVPNGAITTQGRQNYVKVLLSDGTIEERAITTGISDWQYTEVTEGLSEGEKVVVPEGTSTSTTTTQQQGPSETRIFVPGMGGPR